MPDGPSVQAPLLEANLEIVLNWQSSFEHAGAESKAPTLFAMLQAGVLQPIVDQVFNGDKKAEATLKGIGANDLLRKLEGATGITKLNSTQVFSGMPPFKITATAHFRAWSDPATEVEAPFEQLMSWVLPKELARDSTLLSRAADVLKNGGDLDKYIGVLLPSKAPSVVAMHYKGRYFSPMVIESVGMPLNSPIDAAGRYVEMSAPLTICSLTAWDVKDWTNARTMQL